MTAPIRSYSSNMFPALLRRLPIADQLSEILPLLVSPDGRYAVLETYASDIPPDWAAYRDALLHPYIIEPKRPGQRSNVTHYVLLDTSSGKIGPLLDAPMSWFNRSVVWAKDGRSLILSGTYLPLTVGSPMEREARETHTFVAEVEVPSKSIIPITDEPVQISHWNQQDGVLVLGSGENGDINPKAYERAGLSWHRVALPRDKSNSSVPLTVSLEEDSNTPPRIFVTSPKDGRKALLFDLNPSFHT